MIGALLWRPEWLVRLAYYFVRRHVLLKARNLTVPVVYLVEVATAVIRAKGGADE